MADFRKYANLPDLDAAPDVYETPSARTLPAASSPRSLSPASSHTSLSDADTSDDHKDRASRISRRRIYPERARDRFGAVRVDASNVDFSDRLIKDGRRSYRVRSGRRRRQQQQRERHIADDEESDGEETMEVRIARLMREVEEVRGKVEGRGARGEGGGGSEEEEEETLEAVQRMSDTLRELQLQTTVAPANRQSTEPFTQTEQPIIQHPQIPALSPPIPLITLATITTLESRLTALEAALGPSHPTDHPPTQPILSTLSTLESSLSALSTTTAPALSTLSDTITRLTASAARLAETRAVAARAAQDATKARALGYDYNPVPASRPGTAPAPAGGPVPAEAGAEAEAEGPEDLELVAKIDRLYATLPTIEAVGPLVPGVVERLRTLRVLHEDAGAAREVVEGLERGLGALGREVERWREGLDRVERAVGEGSGVQGVNAGVVEAWVRELEERVKELV